MFLDIISQALLVVCAVPLGLHTRRFVSPSWSHTGCSAGREGAWFLRSVNELATNQTMRNALIGDAYLVLIFSDA